MLFLLFPRGECLCLHSVGDKVEALTDFEVLDVVQSQLGRLGTRFQALASAGVDVAAELAKMKLLEHLWILQHVQQFLSALPCAHQDPQSLQNFLEGVVESFQDVLNKQEIAQLINIRPHNIVLLHAVRGCEV